MNFLRLLSILFLLCLFQLSSFGQTNEDFAFENAQVFWKKKLGLNDEQANKFEKVVLNFIEGYRYIMQESNKGNFEFQSEYNTLVKKRDKSLEGFLTEQQMMIYKMVQEDRIEGLQEYFEDLMTALNTNKELASSIDKYNLEDRVPVLLEYRKQFDQEMMENDLKNLSIWSATFRDALRTYASQTENGATMDSKSSINKVFKTLIKDDPENKAALKSLKNLTKQYTPELNAIQLELYPYKQKWQFKIKEIFADNLPYYQVEAFEETFQLLSIFGVEKEIGKLAFFMFDPEQPSSYFQLNRDFHALFFRSLVN